MSKLAMLKLPKMKKGPKSVNYLKDYKARLKKTKDENERRRKMNAERPGRKRRDEKKKLREEIAAIRRK